MPRVEIDYSKISIYMIQHIEDKSLIYVGSTVNFRCRKNHHKSNCYNEKGKEYNYKVYTMIRENGGWAAFQMLEIKKYPCNDKREAEAEEEKCRVELNANMNKIRAFTTEEQRKEQKLKDNYSDKGKARMKKFFSSQKGKELLKRYRLKRSLKPEVIEKRLEKITCECGSIISHLSIYAHRKSKKHIEKHIE